MQSRPDRACRSDSDPVYMIRSRYGNHIRFRSGAPIYTGCNNQIILRSGNSIVFRSGNSIVFRSDTTISFRPGLKLAKFQPDLNPIKTRDNMQSQPDRASRSDSDPIFMTRSTSGNLICFRSGTPISTRCNYLISLRSGNPVCFRSATLSVSDLAFRSKSDVVSSSISDQAS